MVRAELKLHQVKSLPKLMDYTQLIDKKNDVSSKDSLSVNKGSGSTRNYSTTRTVTWDPRSKGTQPKPLSRSSNRDSSSVSTTGSSRGRAFKRFTDVELQENLARGCVIDVMKNLAQGIFVLTSNSRY